jgi:sugar phosphate isomerase/epimerase
VAQALGAPSIRTFACSREGLGGNPSPRYSDGGGIPDDALAKIAKALRLAAEHAQHHGITLALENARAFFANTGGGQRRVVDAVNHPNLKIIWDPANAFVAGETSYPDGWELVKEDIVDVHCKDARVVNSDIGLTEWVAIGDGGVDWKGQMDALHETDIVTLTIETHWHPKGSNKDENTAHVYRQLKSIVDSALPVES